MSLPQNLLGYGYDATGLFCNPVSARKQVIDIDKFEEEAPSRISVYNASSNGETNNFATINSDAYISCLNQTLYNDMDPSEYKDLAKNLFAGELKRYFSASKMVSSREAYASSDFSIQLKRITLIAPNDLISQYLSDQFISDVANQTPEYIVANYGTHVLTSVVLGGKIHYIYKSFANASSQFDPQEIVKQGLCQAISSKSALSGLFELAKQNVNGILSYESVGGDPKLGFRGQISTDSTLTIDVNSWQNSINATNMRLVEIPENNLIPIYVFVTDPAKKLALKNAVIQYINNSSITMVNELLRYYNPTTQEYSYSSDWSDYGNGSNGMAFQKIEGYIYPVETTVASTINLYGSSLGTMVAGAHPISVNPSELNISANNQLGNVYSTSQPNTVPLYRYTNSSTNRLLFTTNTADVAGNADWKLVKIECYILKR